MSFVKEKVNTTPIEDTVFAIVKKAKEAKAAVGAEKIVDAVSYTHLDVYKRQALVL